MFKIPSTVRRPKIASGTVVSFTTTGDSTTKRKMRVGVANKRVKGNLWDVFVLEGTMLVLWQLPREDLTITTLEAARP